MLAREPVSRTPASEGERAFPMFFNPPPIKKQIRQYVAWKSIRYPVAARSHEEILLKFFKMSRIRCATQITPDMVESYLRDYSSIYYRNKTIHVLKQFFKYWYEMGLLVQEFEEKIPEESLPKKYEPPMNVEQAHRVQSLIRNRNLSLRQVKMLMETEDHKTYHLKQIHRWSRYRLSPSGV